ncbi:uncharacterized protein LOC100892443 isoform X1 [Strongylocentrotus purpuratus]|uniref:Uncharacterized protein n=1 Tax=Strongylocentrotus purpuratus TaxID=7668 RepID=A0A7M7GJ64_STRPU|nr:uncharacterized protein LOC100892443 isoform X1 [Strongylocentrotus purpuratus]
MALSENENSKEKIRHLCAAVQAGKLAEIDTILQQGMYINVDEGGNMMAKSLYRNLLMLAIDSVQVETAKLLIERGIDVNHKTWGVNGKQGARDMAQESGLQEIVDQIDCRLPVPKRLFHAVVDGQQDKVNNLLRHIDADMNMKVDLHGDKAAGCSAYTLLMIALRNGHVEIAHQLIDRGIDLDFDHQEWDRPDDSSEEIMVESFDAHKLAMDTGMVGVAKAIDKRRGGVANGNETMSPSNGIKHEKQSDVTNGAEENANITTTQSQMPINTKQPEPKQVRASTSCCCIIS